MDPKRQNKRLSIVRRRTIEEADGVSTQLLNIAGQRISLRTDKSQHQIDAYANQLNEKIEKMRANAPSASMKHILMLTAIQLIEQLDESNYALKMLQNEVDLNTQQMLALLDAADAIEESELEASPGEQLLPIVEK